MKAKQAIQDGDKLFEAVSFIGLKDEILDIFPIIDSVYRKYGYEAIVSSGTEWFYTIDSDPFLKYFIHSLSSKHYRGYAIDVSTGGIPKETIFKMQKEIQERCDVIRPGYEVLWHGHFHIEFDPKMNQQVQKNGYLNRCSSN